MADNDTPKLRYDDFIGSVQPDPAKPESTIMLSGFVGHGPDGHARIYPDPTLGTWYDVPEGDILHSTPIADSKLGGSHIWVRASAQIKPGSVAGSGTESVAEGVPAAGPQPAANIAPQWTFLNWCTPGQTLGLPCFTKNIMLCQAPLAGMAGAPQQAAAAVGMNPTPATHCFVCDPPMAAALQPTPTVQTHCFICPPHTQNCMPGTYQTGVFFCHTRLTGCTAAHVCTQGCQHGGGQQQQLEGVMAAPAHPNTAVALCTQAPACPPPHMHPVEWSSFCTFGCTWHVPCHQPQAMMAAQAHPTPSAVHQCGGQTFTPTIPQFTLFGACPTVGVCPSIACGFTPIQNGVFTPFGR